MVTKFICAPGPGAFFWRTAFEKTGGWDPNIHQFPDIDCWLRLGLHGSFFHINGALAAFRVHNGSQSFSSTPVDRAEEAVGVISKFFELPNLPVELTLAKPVALAHAHLLVAQLHLRSFRYLKAILELFEVVRLSPRSLIRPQAFRMLRNGLLNRVMHKFLWRMRQFRDR
jgi:hypothetical protein